MWIAHVCLVLWFSRTQWWILCAILYMYTEWVMSTTHITKPTACVTYYVTFNCSFDRSCLCEAAVVCRQPMHPTAEQLCAGAAVVGWRCGCARDDLLLHHHTTSWRFPDMHRLPDMSGDTVCADWLWSHMYPSLACFYLHCVIYINRLLSPFCTKFNKVL